LRSEIHYPNNDDSSVIIQTSGTTAKPKLVSISHSMICNSVGNIAATLKLDQSDRMLSIIPLYHIHGLSTLYATLASGGCVISGGDFSPDKFIRSLKQFRPGWYPASPAIHQLILNQVMTCWGKKSFDCLRFVRSASAAMPESLLQDIESKLGVTVIEAYGMTEAASLIASNQLPPFNRKTSSVGKPAGPEVGIIDQQGDFLPADKVGEIVVCGTNVIRHYELEENSQNRFIGKWLRTGDSGYLDQDGYLFVTGRLDVANAETAPMVVQPRNPTEIKLLEIWEQVLQLPCPGINSNFFELGGDSLAATRVLMRIQEAFQLDLPIDAVFKYPTIEALSSQLGQLVSDLIARGEKVLLPSDPPSDNHAQIHQPASTGNDDACPVSFSQQRTLFEQQLGAASSYNMSRALHLTGKLDRSALESSLRQLTHRHDVLRTVFRQSGGHWTQVVLPEQGIALSFVDLSGLTEKLKRTELYNIAIADAVEEYDLEKGPLFRAKLVRLGTDQHVLLLNTHHIISDAWSMVVLVRDITRLYGQLLEPTSSSAQIDPLAMQYADFARQEQQSTHQGRYQKQLRYWTKQLNNLPPDCIFAPDYPRKTALANKGETYSSTIDNTIIKKLETLARTQNVTLFTILLAAFKVLLFRYTQQEDCLVGTPVSGRNQVGTENMIGFFANTLLLRTELSGDPGFLNLLEREHQTMINAYANQEVPFEKIVSELKPNRNSQNARLFQIMFVMHDFSHLQNRQEPATTQLDEKNDLAGPFRESGLDVQFSKALSATTYTVDTDGSKFDLTIYLSRTAKGIVAGWRFNSELFKKQTIERIAEQYVNLLSEIEKNNNLPISQYTLLSIFERKQIEEQWNQTNREYSNSVCFSRMFERQANATPDSTAVIHNDVELSYSELNNRANQLARYIQTVVPDQGAVIGIRLPRNLNAVITLLAVWKTGHASLFIDPEYPEDRIELMIQDAKPSVVITDASVSHTSQCPITINLDQSADLIKSHDQGNLKADPIADNPAYIIYTSGTAGRPNGVVVSQANLRDYVLSLNDELEISTGDRYLHTASFSFSSSIRQLALPLCFGATMVLADKQCTVDPESLLELMHSNGITVLDLVPSHLRSCQKAYRLLDAADQFRLSNNSLRLTLTASEPLHSDLAGEWLSTLGKNSGLINMYGQTETSGIVSLHRVQSRDLAMGVIPVGRPIPNTQIYILDNHLRTVPPGMRGEITVSGSGVSSGYINQEELSREKFLANPFSDQPGRRMYRTGDMGRYQDDGTIEYLGRLDDQVKVNGIRVEPGEIESCLRQHSEVEDVMVFSSCVSDKPGQHAAESETARLVACVIPAAPSMSADTRQNSVIPFHGLSEEETLRHKLRIYLLDQLPLFMVPAEIVFMDEFPKLASGKIYRQAFSSRILGDIRSSHNSELRDKAHHIAPRTQLEKSLATIWAGILNTENIGINDNFFDLGGDSILSMQAVSQANDAGIEIQLKQHFQYQTIAELSAFLSHREKKNDSMARQDQETSNEFVTVSIESLRNYGQEALEKAGLNTEGARIVTEVQLEASLRGQSTHNMVSIPRYARRIASGKINPDPKIVIESEAGFVARIDGDNGPGQWVASCAMDLAIKKCKEHGIGIVTARRSNHFGAAGHYPWLASHHGFIGLSTTNGPVILAPTGGLTPTFGNNPLAVAIPAEKYEPILVDITMSVAPRGKIGLKLAEGQPLPEGWILDDKGSYSTDLSGLVAGLGVPIGEHKGYGLAMVMETLAGVLSGSGFCMDHGREQIRINSSPPDTGHFFMVIDPKMFMDQDEFKARVDRMISDTKRGEKIEGIKELLVPGERELKHRKHSIENGVALRSSTYRALISYAAEAELATKLEILDISNATNGVRLP